MQKGRSDVQRQFRELQELYLRRNYKTRRGREYAHQGFCRRLDELARAVDFVFDLLPPGLDEIRDKDNVVAATMLIQSFVLNASGCLDNLAWIWVYETDLKSPQGAEIDPKWVGLGESYTHLRKSFSRPFRKHLRSRRKWFHHLAEFRDSAAHRIPLYIPPYIISETHAPRYNELGNECIEAMRQGDYEKYDKLRAEQKKLGRFLPWMSHSLIEKSPTAVFHFQLLQDYATIDEFGRKILEELARFEEMTRRRKAPSTFGLRNVRDCLRMMAQIFQRFFWRSK